MSFFFFKQKTAYEMRISDWSSDVCSSDLVEGETKDAIERLVAKMEDGAWSTASLGPRYEKMLGQIIAFRAHVRSAEHSFKLGQDESPQGLAEIVAGHSDRTPSAWTEGPAGKGSFSSTNDQPPTRPCPHPPNATGSPPP